MATAESAGAHCFLEVQEGVRHAHLCPPHGGVRTYVDETFRCEHIVSLARGGGSSHIYMQDRRVKRQTHAGMPGNPAR